MFPSLAGRNDLSQTRGLSESPPLFLLPHYFDIKEEGCSGVSAGILSSTWHYFGKEGEMILKKRLSFVMILLLMAFV